MKYISINAPRVVKGKVRCEVCDKPGVDKYGQCSCGEINNHPNDYYLVKEASQ